MQLARGYFVDVVQVLLATSVPDIPYAVGRLGSGSDVLGLDDVTSRDHDWGLRLTVLVDAEHVSRLDDILAERLPMTYAGWPTRFATTFDPSVAQRVEVADPTAFAESRLGLHPLRLAAEPRLWLALTGQSVLEVVGGPVFVDQVGAITAIRRQLDWYPDDIWRHVLAADWQRISQELPFVGRTADVGDELGSRLITARLAGTLVHLAFMLERAWSPYPKWAGTVLSTRHTGPEIRSALDAAMSATTWADREVGLVGAIGTLWRRQHELGLPVADVPTEQFFDRPYRAVPETAVTRLIEAIGDPELRSRPPVGSVEQWVDSVDVLVDPAVRLRLTSRSPT